jgi:tripartite-type tricarboxylate transporter receptor subunit TctC
LQAFFKEKNMHLLTGLLIVPALAFAFPPLAWPQAWPVKPIRLVVNFPPGSGPDLITRIYAPHLGEALSQKVVVDNRPGAAGNIGMEAVAKSAPDGYTLLNSPGGPIIINPHLYKLGIDVNKDLEPVAPSARTSMFLVVRPSLPVYSVAELVAHARANPHTVNYGSPGSGSMPHISAEMMFRAAKIRVNHVPYKGSAQVLADLLGDQINFTFDPGVAVPQIRAGKLRLLAVTSAARSPIFPDIPTMAEAGMDVNTSTLSGVYAPAGISREIVARLNREISRIMQTAESRAALAGIATESFTASPEQFAAQQRYDRDRFGALVREANIRAD